jgi:hypothetical protein
MNDLPQWRWKRWDVRADGKVFWAYYQKSKNGQYWVTWENALKYQNNSKTCTQKYRKTTQGHDYLRNYRQDPKIKEYTSKYQKSYRKTKKQKDYKKNYMRCRRGSDPMFAMVDRLRNRIATAILRKGYSKTSKTSEMLGCDWNHFMAHLESRFVDGMNWNNRHLWHIDHITPLASATSEEELIKLNHYTNLQPLWAEDNIRKGNRICANVPEKVRKPS